MKGHRLFERFGFNLPANTRDKTGTFASLDHYEEWVFDPKQSDWINAETEQALSGYSLPPVG